MRRLPALLLTFCCPASVRGAGSCSGSGSSCVCDDGEGNSWDIGSLTAGADGAETQVVARGVCSGTYCTGTFGYYVDVCNMLTVPQACNIGQCCLATDQLNLYRLEQGPRGTTCTVGGSQTGCQCDKLGEGPGTAGLSVTAYDQDGDEGLTIQYTNNAYYNSYAGWVPPILNLICDSSAASTAYTETSSASTNPEVINAPGCTTNYCSVVINWRTPAACISSGLGWTITLILLIGGARASTPTMIGKSFSFRPLQPQN